MTVTLAASLLLGTGCQSEEESNPTERYCDALCATEYGRQFCVTYATHVFSCGYEFSAQACEAAFGIFADEALERLTACTHEPCDRLDACQYRTLWGEP